MKKLFVILMVACLVLSVLSITAFAAEETTDEPASNVVLRIRANKTNGKPEFVEDHTDFVTGWNAAISLAEDSDRMEEKGYVRVIVDIYADWTAGTDGFSSSGDGFLSNAICFPADVRVTLNMNGHTINRAISPDRNTKSNGEVMIIKSDADIIINNGTITGGGSFNGAGGIHVKGAFVMLNNVNVVGNASEGDAGSGIALYSGSTLIMNGGSISDNDLRFDDTDYYTNDVYGSLYVDSSTARLTNVTLSNNQTTDGEGTAIYADDSTVTLKDCVVSGNSTEGESTYIHSIIAAEDSKLDISNTQFTDNGMRSNKDTSRLFYLEDCEMKLTGGKITDNKVDELFYLEDSDVDIKGVTITDNASAVLNVDNGNEVVTLTDCTLGNNTPYDNRVEIVVETKDTLEFKNCTLGDTTFENKSLVNGAASIISDGSLSMILIIVSLSASATAICLAVALNRKKTVRAE